MAPSFTLLLLALVPFCSAYTAQSVKYTGANTAILHSIATLSDCHNSCVGEQACVCYTWQSSSQYCWLKTEWLPTLQTDATWTGYQSSCLDSNRASSVVETNVDYNGNDVANIHAPGEGWCAAACYTQRVTLGCKSWSYDASVTGNNCWLKNAQRAQLVVKTGVNSGVVSTATCSSSTEPNVLYWANNYVGHFTGVKTMEECCYKCAENPACLSWSYITGIAYYKYGGCDLMAKPTGKAFTAGSTDYYYVSGHVTYITRTAAPTPAPTGVPTPAPTAAPTTPAPTGVPTVQPSHSPSSLPTSAPTSAPTGSPTAAPSHQPSRGPSVRPTTSAPSAQPSARPTLAPTVKCTDVVGWMDSANKTCSGSQYSSEWCANGAPLHATFLYTIYENDGETALTACCTCGGGNWHTASPTRVPSAVPTARPTLVPTSGPSRRPTRTPSQSPTVACSDVAGWVDSDGESCTSRYSTWCSAGQPLLPVTFYPIKSNAGHTGLTACCVCGGGILGTGVPSLKPTASPTRLPSLRPTRVPTFTR